MSNDVRNDVRIYMRANKFEKDVLKRAARISGHRNLTNFIMTVALRCANQVIAENNNINSMSLRNNANHANQNANYINTGTGSFIDNNSHTSHHGNNNYNIGNNDGMRVPNNNVSHPFDDKDN